MFFLSKNLVNGLQGRDPSPNEPSSAQPDPLQEQLDAVEHNESKRNGILPGSTVQGKHATGGFMIKS